MDPDITDIETIISAASVYKYPGSYAFICWSWRGVMTVILILQLRVIDDIISPFNPESAENLDECICLFFVDCWLKTSL